MQFRSRNDAIETKIVLPDVLSGSPKFKMFGMLVIAGLFGFVIYTTGAGGVVIFCIIFIDSVFGVFSVCDEKSILDSTKKTTPSSAKNISSLPVGIPRIFNG
jgi:magnesium-transporting ATPase (P-type)